MQYFPNFWPQNSPCTEPLNGMQFGKHCFVSPWPTRISELEIWILSNNPFGERE